MDNIEQAGQMVVVSYGQFLESIGVNYYHLKKKLECDKIDYVDYLGVEVMCNEHSSVYEKVDTNNKIYNKIIIVFTVVCKEVLELKKELMTNYLPRILQYGKGCTDKTSNEEGQGLMCEFLPVLLDVYNFVHRCRATLVHLIQQLICAYESPWINAQNSSNTQFMEVFSTLGNLLLILITLDVSLTTYNDNIIGEHLKLLEKTMKASDDKNFLSDYQTETLRRVTSEVKRELLKGNIFQVSLHAQFEKKHCLNSCMAFKNNLNHYIKVLISEIECNRVNEVHNYQLLSKMVALHIFATNVFGLIDKKTHKNISELSKKHVVVPLLGEVLWLPYQHLAKHLELKLREQGIKFPITENLLLKHLEQLESNLAKTVKSYSTQIFTWSIIMENTLSIDSINIKLNDIDSALLCLEGLDHSANIKFCINHISFLHSSLGIPMTKIVALNLCKLAELLNVIQSVFTRHHIAIGKRVNHILQHMLIQVLSHVNKVKRDPTKTKTSRDTNIDSYSALELVEKLLYGACSEENLLLVRLILTFTNPDNSLFGDGFGAMAKLLDKLLTMCQLRHYIYESTNSYFVAGEGYILPVYFKYIMDTQANLSRIQYMLNSSNDDKTEDFQIVNEDIFIQQKGHFQSLIVNKLCQEIETFLRIHAHSHLQKETVVFPLDKDFKSLLRVLPLTVSGYITSIRGLIETYLDKTFYDLATVALHDWQTYKEMRSIAEHKFHLCTVEDNLPSHTLAQGLDILQIMRNIHIFVCKYLYNLNTQCFLESSSNSKHLNSIRIPQIANSICTHGTGVMNTTTNFVYQFLKKKLIVFSQFLYDENISSRLKIDLNYFSEKKAEKNFYYPYEKAFKFNKGISRLGLSSDGTTYLDQYRALISQIGNALGYVRMVRTGGSHHCLQAASYLPQIDYVCLSKENLGSSGTAALDSFDKIIFNIIHNLSEGTEHLKLLVDVFSSLFNTPENSHLKLFAMIIPPLTINYVDYMVTAKEKMTKRNRDGTIFTDDGFPIGVTYLLAVLNLYTEFDSLHWFESVNRKFEYEEESIRRSNDLQREDSTHENTLKLSIRRLQMFKQEFQFLYYNMNSARVFFESK